MGRRKVFVASTAVKLLSETPDITKDSVVAGAIGGGRKDFCMDNILKNYHNSIAIQANNYYRYGQKHYTLGLPQGSKDLGLGDDAAVGAVLSGLEGETVTIVSNVLDYFKPEPWGYMHMQDSWGWNPDTDVLAAPPVDPLQAEDSEVSYSHVVFLGSNSLRFYLIETWEEGKRKKTHTVDVTVPAYGKKDIWYNVIYQTTSKEQDQYWYYNEATNAYPSLDQPDALSLESPFYPIVPVRLDNQDMTAEELHDSAMYETSKSILNKFDLDFGELSSAIHDNPDIDDVDHAFVMMGVNIQEESQAAIRYLTEFFLYLGEISATKRETYEAWQLPPGYNYQSGLKPSDFPPQNLITIEDSKFKIELHYNFIETKVLSGAIKENDKGTGKVGHCTRECIVNPVSDFNTYQKEDSHVIFRKQVTEAEYLEVIVSGLLHKNFVYEGHTVDTNVEDSLKEDENNFVIPLNRNVVRRLPLTLETQLIYDSFQVVFNSYEVVKLKWYQTGFFKILVIVVAVVVSIYTGYWDSVFQAVSAANGVLGVATAILQQVAVAFAISTGFQLLAEALGFELAMILAVVAMAAGAMQFAKNNTIAGLPTADLLLQTSQALSSGAAGVVQDEFQELLDEVEAFEKYQEEHQKELDEILEELNSPPDIDPYHFVGQVPVINQGETPSEFYFRTVHSGNVGVFSLDAIDNYVENALTLPSSNETLT